MPPPVVSQTYNSGNGSDNAQQWAQYQQQYQQYYQQYQQVKREFWESMININCILVLSAESKIEASFLSHRVWFVLKWKCSHLEKSFFFISPPIYSAQSAVLSCNCCRALLWSSVTTSEDHKHGYEKMHMFV